MTEGHEVYSKRNLLRDDGTLGILLELEQEPQVSQRSLANRLGIALGLTNLLLHRLVRNGYVRVRRVSANRIAYFLTPSGLAEKTRMVQERFSAAVASYAEAKHRIITRLDSLEAHWPVSEWSEADGRHVLILGVSEASEIAFLCLQGSSLTLQGFVDDRHQGQEVFGQPVFACAGVDADLAAVLASTRAVVLAFHSGEEHVAFLRRHDIPQSRLFLL